MKYRVPFTLSAQGEIVLDAVSVDDAAAKAEAAVRNLTDQRVDLLDLEVNLIDVILMATDEDD